MCPGARVPGVSLSRWGRVSLCSSPPCLLHLKRVAVWAGVWEAGSVHRRKLLGRSAGRLGAGG